MLVYTASHMCSIGSKAVDCPAFILASPPPSGSWSLKVNVAVCSEIPHLEPAVITFALAFALGLASAPSPPHSHALMAMQPSYTAALLQKAHPVQRVIHLWRDTNLDPC